MTSSPIAGFQGQFKVSTTALIQIKTCQIQVKGQTYDITVMTGLSTPAWKLFLAGLQEWTLKVTGLYDFANDAVQATLWAALGTTVSISFSPNTGTNKFSGSAILTGVPFGFDVAKEDTVDWEFQGSGQLSYA